MPVNTLGNTGGGISDWFESLPKITRTFAVCNVITSAMLSWGIPHVMYMLLDWRYVFSSFQIWRLVTHTVVLGPFGFGVLIKLIWILTYGTQLEAVVYEHHPEDYLFLFIFSTACLTAISLLLSPFVLGLYSMVATSEAIVMILLYLWSKEFPEQDIKLYGLISIKGFYLPFVFIGLDVLMGHMPIAMIAGVLVAHAWFFLTNLLPRATGKEYLPTPDFVKRLALRMGLRATPPAPPPGAAPPSAPSGFRAFGGRAHRLY